MKLYLKVAMIISGMALFAMVLITHSITSPSTKQSKGFKKGDGAHSRKVAQQKELGKKAKLTAVLFTTFRNSSDKLFIHSNTVRNWATFLPHIQPVLFTTFNSGPLIDLAKASGWIVYPYNETNQYGAPFLKPMYKKAMVEFDAHFYAFCNGDILFGSGLSKTLDVALKHMHILNTMLIVGRRWDHELNSDISVYNDHPIWKPQKVTSLANRNFSQLHGTKAKDYFFVTKDFLWSRIKNVVIGRIYYDNYLVDESYNLNVTTIDATSTVPALHESGQDGNHAGLKGRNLTMQDRQYNGRVIGNHNFPNGDFHQIQIVTKIVDNKIVIGRKTGG